MTHCDLVIRNATIVDGTRAPRFRADVAIRNGQAGAAGLVRSEYSVLAPCQAQVIQGNVHGPGQLEDIVAVGQVASVKDGAAPGIAVIVIALDGDPGNRR